MILTSKIKYKIARIWCTLFGITWYIYALVLSRMGYSPGAREPGSHEIFRLTQNVGRNSRVFVTNLTGKCFLQNEAKSSCQTNAFLQKEEIFWCKSIITNRHFPQEEMSCHRKKFLATVRNLLPQEDFL